ncbi:hypothetical protein PVK06_004765 [Gossypium arboreum]|uniref:Uncharacterized protein n=1 Tax=Gossypium arboreum TaxID=29729 RepID=A0ABR0QSV4_GOSAR|nr:hypothetical protein PVK06_004765 [Gossypium arboreum]
MQKENNGALKCYKVETKAGIQGYLPKLRSNHILHTEVVMGPFDASQVNFIYMRKLTNINLGFNALKFLGVEWEEFQKKWKESDNLLFSLEPKPTTPNPIKEAGDEGEEYVDETIE